MAQNITLDDLLQQARMARKLGPFAGILKYTSGHVPLERDGESLRRIEGVISSLSLEERRHPQSITDERIPEIANSNGLSEEDIRKFFRQLEVMNDLRSA